ncbi:MAG: hypothetical protein A2X68_12015 [Ignavibacteria bacterium GWC2_56_12]|nr:MAG: hypothetical protein A2X68_12015 [Ignavibacteria bacterium GWC2_56_12]
MKTVLFASTIVLLALLTVPAVLFQGEQAFAYPPGVGILSKAKNCLVCHANNGPWSDEDRTIIDIVAVDSKQSFRQSDGSFLLQVKRNEPMTVRTVIGRKKHAQQPAPYRIAWMYVDSTTIGTSSLSKFAPGWEVNLQLACRIVGDPLEGNEDATLTVLPMIIRPLDAARNAELTLQVMLTMGESVKGKAKEGMIANYFERRVKLVVLE